MVYKFRDGSRFPVRPQVAGEELARIGRANGGKLIPSAVVVESRPDEAPLHRCFEWEDEVAAERYREEQARLIIRCVVCVEQAEEDRPPSEIQAYVHVVKNDEPCYMTTSHVMSDDELRAQAIDEALTLLMGIRRRFEHLKELRGIFAAIDDLARRKGRGDAGKGGQDR